uniref:Uncharacterized protein n=1 Tax=Nelumbo nucifera TaxID=4432 RepID=A0A822XZG6_NELNU|nr:TPA_asm: hypothetical protein HUJ06_026075 [Nelumbo nucifera]
MEFHNSTEVPIFRLGTSAASGVADTDFALCIGISICCDCILAMEFRNSTEVPDFALELLLQAASLIPISHHLQGSLFVLVGGSKEGMRKRARRRRGGGEMLTFPGNGSGPAMQGPVTVRTVSIAGTGFAGEQYLGCCT